VRWPDEIGKKGQSAQVKSTFHKKEGGREREKILCEVKKEEKVVKESVVYGKERPKLSHLENKDPTGTVGISGKSSRGKGKMRRTEYGLARKGKGSSRKSFFGEKKQKGLTEKKIYRWRKMT